VNRRGGARLSVLALATALAGLGGCGDETVPAADLGARLFANSKLSPSPINAFSCATCHPVVVTELADADAGAPPDAGPTDRHPGPIHPGYNLFDSVHRPSWWGGTETRLLDAMNYCLVEFMGGAALDATAPSARELYEYLKTVSPDDPSPALSLTVVKNIDGLLALKAGADPARGGDVFGRGCRGCHGQPHTGEGKLGSKTSIVPEDTITGPVCNPNHDPGALTNPAALACARTVVVEKVRHGKFFNIGGTMPLYSIETLSDVEIADVLAFLGL